MKVDNYIYAVSQEKTAVNFHSINNDPFVHFHA